WLANCLMAAPRHLPMKFRSLCGNYILGRLPVKWRAEKEHSRRRELHFAGLAKALAGGALVALIEARFWSNSFSFLAASRTSKSARVGGKPGSERARPTWSRLFR